MKKTLAFLFTLIFIWYLISCNNNSVEAKSEKKNNSRESVDSETVENLKINLCSYNTLRDSYSSKSTIRIVNNSILLNGVRFVDSLELNNFYSKRILQVLNSKPATCLLADCYDPRHILLFYRNQKLIGYFEFCVECGGSSQSSNLHFETFCLEKGKDLIKIFKEMKLKNTGEINSNLDY